jgi:hypothetical protein
MVEGLEKFKEYFNDFPGNYIIIGGAACDIIIGNAGLRPRATKDIDIILIVEAMNKEFVSHFWEFIKTGDYEKREKSSEERKYYRFQNPANPNFPKQIELFSRKPDILDLDQDTHLTPIPIDEDLSSLSAILMNDIYYHFTIEHSVLINELKWANIEALICLKARAFLDMISRKERREKIDEGKIKKHKNDVFRLAILLAPESKFDLPPTMRADLEEFIEKVKDDLPGNDMFKELGVGGTNPKELINILSKGFNLHANEQR